MTNREDLPETVNVPVGLLKELIATASDSHLRHLDAADKAIALLLKPKPKPKPRLVAVPGNFRDWHDQPNQTSEEYLDAQPDLLALLDDVLLETVDSLTARLTLRVRIRAALGVTE